MRVILSAFAAAIVLCLLPAPYADKAPAHVTKAVYAWQNELYMDSESDSLLQEKGFKYVYVKILEIDWSPVFHAAPIVSNPMTYQQSMDSNFVFIPVVFITNEAIAQTPKGEIPELAGKLFLKIKTLCNFDSIPEIQLDCDWTASTKDTYFELIKELKERAKGKTISVTLRLHQYKYRARQGIPPADKCMLMLYNMGHITDYNETNSIYNHKETMKYINGESKYPLKLDIALPAFSWAVVFRNKKFQEINHSISKEFADTCKSFTRLPNGNYFTNIDYPDVPGGYLRYGDEIRVEVPEPGTLKNVVSAFRKVSNCENPIVSFFEFQSIQSNNPSFTDYEKLFAPFQ